jgi:Zn-dependent peptidase ImmA (M78 family)
MTLSNEWLSLTDEQKEIILPYQNEFPIKVGAIAKDLGIIVKKATLSAGISGQIKETDGVCTIRVNRHEVKARQRFTLAHEIAHFLLHRELLVGDGITDDILYRSSLSDPQESEANRLAADIVMPWELIKNHLESYQNLKIEEKIEKLGEKAEISTTAIKIRLGKI